MTSDHHLDPETLRRLLRGDLPPDDARRIAAHLARECPECEALAVRYGECEECGFIESDPEADADDRAYDLSKEDF